MPRIRTIKPEFWDSPDTAKAGLRTRLLYMAMWNWADDYGIGDGHHGRLINFAFPNDGIPASDYPRNFSEVSSAFGVVFFEHDGRPFYVIPGWERHQRTEKKAKPAEALLAAAQNAIAAAKSARQSRNAESPRNSADAPTNVAELQALEREREREREVKNPPTPRDEPAPVVPIKSTDGRGEALARFDRLNGTARTPEANAIAQAFSDSLPVPIESSVVADIAVQIDKCLRDAIPPPAIAAGIRDWAASDSWSPSQIPNFVAKAACRRNGVGKATRKAVDYHQAADELIAEMDLA